MRFHGVIRPFTPVLLLALAACAQPAGTAGATDPPAQRIASGVPPRNQCHAEAAQFLVGQPFGPATLQRALEAAGADEARMLRPDSVITKEYKAGRLNVVVGADAQVLRVYCG